MMTHRTRFMISIVVPIATVVVMAVVAPGTNSQFTDTDTGTTNITTSNDPDQYPQPDVAELAPTEPTAEPEVEQPEVQQEMPVEEPTLPVEPTEATEPAEVVPSPEIEIPAEEPSIEATPSPTPTPEEGDTNDEESNG